MTHEILQWVKQSFACETIVAKQHMTRTRESSVFKQRGMSQWDSRSKSTYGRGGTTSSHGDYCIGKVDVASVASERGRPSCLSIRQELLRCELPETESFPKILRATATNLSSSTRDRLETAPPDIHRTVIIRVTNSTSASYTESAYACRT